MLSGQRIYNFSRLNLRSGYPGSTLMCNSVLSEYPCLKKKADFQSWFGHLPKTLLYLQKGLCPRHSLVSPVLLIRPVSDTPSPIKSWLPYYWSAKPSLVRGGEQSWREALEVLFLVTVQCSTTHHWVHTYFEGLYKSTALTENMDVFGVQRGCSVAHISAQFQRQSFLFKLLWIKLQKFPWDFVSSIHFYVFPQLLAFSLCSLRHLVLLQGLGKRKIAVCIYKQTIKIKSTMYWHRRICSVI